jgi:hypothetical protein
MARCDPLVQARAGRGTTEEVYRRAKNKAESSGCCLTDRALSCAPPVIVDGLCGGRPPDPPRTGRPPPGALASPDAAARQLQRRVRQHNARLYEPSPRPGAHPRRVGALQATRRRRGRARVTAWMVVQDGRVGSATSTDCLHAPRARAAGRGRASLPSAQAPGTWLPLENENVMGSGDGSMRPIRVNRRPSVALPMRWIGKRRKAEEVPGAA